ncbi:hypothetical protein PoB_007057300 [Plakobranchus ocellatus]|uniref:Uncharacterized protein n=1 Tax=Plakobranchus ocellatus TaxID=259542 RepID=A0AAV4DIM2_9GAST|nr:hypothetical protein PoB_007057300 [Plakobranchus ocellatus]
MDKTRRRHFDNRTQGTPAEQRYTGREEKLADDSVGGPCGEFVMIPDLLYLMTWYLIAWHSVIPTCDIPACLLSSVYEHNRGGLGSLASIYNNKVITVTLKSSAGVNR